MTTKSTHAAVGPSLSVPALVLDAIGRRYEAVKATIADPWPATEAIDVSMIQPPGASPDASQEPASTSCPHEIELAGGRLVPDLPAIPGRHRRAWRRWFTLPSGSTPEAP